MRLLQAIRGVGTKINRPSYRPLKLAIFLSLFVHIIGLPFIFKSCKGDKPNPKQPPKEMVVDIRIEKPVKQKKCGADCELPDNKAPVSPPKKKERKLAMLSKTPASRMRIRKYKRRAKKAKSPENASRPKSKVKTEANKIKTRAKPIALSKLMPRIVTVVREGRAKRGGSYVSPDILKDSGNAADRIFSGSSGSSFADNGRLPAASGSECGSGNCNPVKYLGRKQGLYHWKDKSGKCYVSAHYPEPGECFQATPVSSCSK